MNKSFKDKFMELLDIIIMVGMLTLFFYGIALSFISNPLFTGCLVLAIVVITVLGVIGMKGGYADGTRGDKEDDSSSIDR